MNTTPQKSPAQVIGGGAKFSGFPPTILLVLFQTKVIIFRSTNSSYRKALFLSYVLVFIGDNLEGMTVEIDFPCLDRLNMSVCLIKSVKQVPSSVLPLCRHQTVTRPQLSHQASWDFTINGLIGKAFRITGRADVRLVSTGRSGTWTNRTWEPS